jgi:hypothetical protein
MKICLFMPNSAILPHFFAELRIADIIQTKTNHDVQLITCDSFFENSCTSSSYLGDNSNELNLTSKSCIACHQAVQRGGVEDFDNYSLGEFFTKESIIEYEKARDLVNSNPIDFEYLGVPLGRISLYELVLEFKKIDLQFTTAQQAKVQSYTRNSLKTFLAALNYFECHHPDRVILFNPQYGVPASFAKAAELMGIPVYSVSFTGVLGEMRQFVRSWSWTDNKLVSPFRKEWSEGSYFPTRGDLRRLKREQRFIRTGRSPWTYSQPASKLTTEDTFLIPPGSKIILAVMNSTDEVFAAKVSNLIPESMANSKVFQTQEDWIERLIEEVSKMKDTYLIVRPHPREYPNKRESVTAVTSERRVKILQNLPRNVVVDAPTLRFPLENHFQSVSVLTTGWSSVGLDWQIRGKPTVTYDCNLTGYPAQTHYSGDSVDEYFANLRTALSGNSDMNDDHTINATSWYCFSNFKKSIRIGSSLLDERIVGTLLTKSKISGTLSRLSPRFYLRLQLSRTIIYSDWKGILRLFELVDA